MGGVLQLELHPVSGCLPPMQGEGKMGLKSIIVDKKWSFLHAGMAVGWAGSLSMPGICQLAGKKAANLNKQD